MPESSCLDTGIQGIRELIKSLQPKAVIPTETSNLIECGIDSIQMMRLVSRWRKSKIKITFADLIEEPTLKAWSEKLTKKAGGTVANPEAGTPVQTAAVEYDTDYDLTDVQYAYWIGREDGQQLGGVSCHAYLEIVGRNIDPARLEKAFSGLIEAHTMLRTVFTAEGKQRNVKENRNDPLKVHDLSAASMAEAEKQAAEIRERNSHRRLAIEEGKVIGLELLRYPDGSSRIFFDIDLLVADVQSLNILLHDLASLYAGKKIKAPLNWSFRDYLITQQKENAEQQRAAENYWNARTESMTAGPELPYTGSTSVKSRFTRHRVTIAADVWNRIRSISLAHGITPAMTLATAYSMVLARWSSTKKFLINVPLFNRNTGNEILEHAVSDFTNLLLLECDFTQNLSFIEHARKLQEQFHKDSAYTCYSAIRVLRNLSRNEKNSGLIAPVVFACNLGTALIDEEVSSSLGNLDYMISQTPQVCLDHQIYEMPDGLMVCFDAVESVFPEGLIDEMFNTYAGLLTALGTAENSFENTYLDELPASQKEVRSRVNDTAAPVTDTLIAERIFANAAKNPDDTAIFYGDSEISYARLYASVMRVAAMLVQNGVKPHDRVAISVTRGPLQIISVLAILAAGAVYVPISVTQPSARKNRILVRAGIRTILTSEPFEPADGISATFLDPMDASGCEPLAHPVKVDPDSAAYIIFTSGSTGEPKGVEISHRGAMNTILDVTKRAGISASDCAMAISAMDFDLSVFDVFGILGAGGKLVVIDEDERRDAALWLDLVHRHHVTVWNSVPVLLDMLLVAAGNDSRVLPLKTVMLSGDWIGLDIPQRLADCCGGKLPYFMAMGGATEGSIWSNLFTVTLPLDPKLKSIPYGYPLANQRYRVVDSLGRDCPDFVPGELLIGGTGVALGYANSPEITAERFFTENGERWYRTGDQGRYLAGGCLEFLGRKDHQVKVRGHRIELGEIEAALTSVSGITRAVAVTVSNPPQLAVAVETASGVSMTADGLRSALSGIVPEYMVPHHIEFYETMPVSANGKIDRKTIIRELNELNPQESYEAPEGHVEETVAAVWQQILNLEKVGRNDSFFEAGGDSLLATRVISELARVGLTSDAPLKALFATPKLKDFSASLSEGHAKNLFTVKEEPDNRYEPFPLTEVQRAYWMGQVQGLALNSKTYYLVELEGHILDNDRLNKAFDLLASRHEMLRSHVTDDGMQVIERKNTASSVVFTCCQTREQAKEAAKEWWNRLNQDETNHPFAVAGFVYGDSMRLSVAFSYMNLDGFSVKLMLKELAEAYTNPEEYASRAPLTLSFRDYVLSAETDEESMAAAKKYWDEKINGMPDAPQLPLASKPDGIQNSHFIRVAHTLDRNDWNRLKEKARKCGITPSAVLLQAYASTLSRYSSENSITVNMTLFDRRPVHDEILSVAGDFTSLLPVTYKPSLTKSFTESVKDLAGELAAGLDHRELSSIHIQRELSKRKGLGMASLPVIFTSTLGVGDENVSDINNEFLSIADGGMSETPQVWLDHQLYEKSEGIYLTWDYVEGLFDESLINEMFACYLDLVYRIVNSDWNEPICPALPQSAVETRNRINDTAAPITDTLIAERIFANAAKNPDDTAIFYGDSEISYARLYASVMRVAAMLVQNGVKPHDRVAVSVTRGPLQIISVLAVLAAGAVYVPISVTQPSARKNRILARAGIRTVLTSEPFEPADGISATFLDPMDASGCEPLAHPVKVDPDSAAYIIFTSGSTGEPKGVEISHRGAMNTILDVTKRAGISASDCAMAISAMDFDLSVFDVFGILGAGGKLVVIDEDERRDAALWLDLVHRHHVTVWNSVPVLLDMLLVAAQNDSRILPLRAVMLSGDWIGLDIPQRLADCCGGKLPYFMAMGGATEGSIWSNLFTVTLPLDPKLKSIPYGYPLANQRYRVVDSLGRDCPDFVPGELLIGGTGVALGYANSPEITAERFFTENGERWYRTGDQGRYLAGGCLEFLGRKDHQVKVRGHRIELGEIEAALTSVSGITRAVAVTVSNPPQLAVAVETASGVSMTADGLRSALSGIVPEYMVPHHIEFYETMPVSANGKIDRKTIIRELNELKPQDEYEAPKGRVEETVADVWKQILSIEKVSRNDSFFEAGGDSLMATRVISELAKAGLTSDAPLKALFSAPKLKDFSATLTEGRAKKLFTVKEDPDNRYEPFPLTEVQRAYWMGQAPGLPLNSKTYYLVEMEGNGIDLDRLGKAVDMVVQRHEMLRTEITADGRQRILPHRPCGTIETTATANAEKAKEALNSWWDMLNGQDASYPYAINAFTYGADMVRMALAFSYMNLDGFSIKMIIRELSDAYRDPEAYAAMRPVNLSFRDYVLSCPEDENALKKAYAYWDERIEELPPAPQLPVITNPDRITKSHFVRVAHTINHEDLAKLKAKAKKFGLTPSAVMLHAYAEVLCRYSGTNGVTINMTLFDRQNVHEDIYRVAGDFTSLVPVAYRPAVGRSFAEGTAKLAEALAEALDHREFSSIHIQRELSKRKGLSMASLPVVFTSTLGIADDLLSGDSEKDFLTITDGGLSETPQVWLDHQLYEKKDGLYLSWDYVSELYDSKLIEEMFGCYRNLIQTLISEDWQQPIASVLPADTVRTRAIVNTTSAPITNLLLAERIFVNSVANPDDTAIFYGDGEISYGRLYGSVMRVAGMLVQNGVKPHDRVAVSVARGPLQIISVLAVLATGAVYVPVSVTQPVSRKNKIISRALIRTVLTTEPFETDSEHQVKFLDPMEASTCEPLSEPVKVSPDSAAYIIFTSGSTGEPKGVEISHRGAMNTILDVSKRAGISSSSCAMAISAMDFDLSVFDVFGILGAGGRLVVIDEDERRDASLWLELVHQHGITVWNSVPVLLDMLLVAAQNDSRILPLRAVMLSGDWIGLDIPQRLADCCGKLPYFMAMGGATEGSIWSNLFTVTLPLDPKLKSIPYGYPLANQRYRVVDSLGRDCPDFVPGELLIGGTGVALGYANSPEITAERFFTENGERWYRTGDQGRYLAGGCLEFLGRKDHQVKVRGHRIELGEIEAALTSVSGITRAVAVTVSNPPQLAVAVETASGVSMTAEGLRSALSGIVPEYMVPHHIEFYETMPVSANGKIDRKIIIRDLNGKSCIVREEDLPQGELEIRIADIWKKILKIENISRNDDFFTAGGDSLSATRFVQTLQNENITSEPLPLRTLFSTPTIASISGYIENNNLWVAGCSEGNSFEEGTL